MPGKVRVLTVAEAVSVTKLSERQVRAMMADGRLPVVRLEGLRSVRIPEEAIDKLMQVKV